MLQKQWLQPSPAFLKACHGDLMSKFTIQKLGKIWDRDGFIKFAEGWNFS